MSKVPVFYPALSTLCFIKSTGFDIDKIKKKMSSLCSGSKYLGSNIHKKGDFLILEIIRVIKYDDGMPPPKIIGNMRAVYKENIGLVKKLLKSLPGTRDGGNGPLTFNLFTLGSESSFLSSEPFRRIQHSGK